MYLTMGLSEPRVVVWLPSVGILPEPWVEYARPLPARGNGGGYPVCQFEVRTIPGPIGLAIALDADPMDVHAAIERFGIALPKYSTRME